MPEWSMRKDLGSPSMYVETYGKYASGSIAGAWLNLEDYADEEDFLEACAELHKDEEDPEFMFQDFSGFPRALYQESGIHKDLWAWLELDEDEKELLEVYLEHINQHGTIKEAKEEFRGKYESSKDWAIEHWEESGLLNEIPAHLRGYIDYEQYAYDMGIDAVIFIDKGHNSTWVFNR
jgi:antirestriction protein